MIKTNPNYIEITKEKDELIKCVKLALELRIIGILRSIELIRFMVFLLLCLLIPMVTLLILLPRSLRQKKLGKH